MKENNIIFDDPISASMFINNNYENILNWWHSEKCSKKLEKIFVKYTQGETKKFFL